MKSGSSAMIVLRIPKKVNNRDLTNFITVLVKKFRKNAKHKYIQLRGEIAYSDNSVYFILHDYALELAFALSLYFKCQKHQVPCTLEISKAVDLERMPAEIVEAAKVWSERKLPRRHYKLRNLPIY